MLEKLNKYPLSLNKIRSWGAAKINENSNGKFHVNPDNHELIDPIINEVVTYNPVMLFNMFDDNDVFISIFRDVEKKCFGFSIDGAFDKGCYSTRNETEKQAFNFALEVLEKNIAYNIDVIK